MNNYRSYLTKGWFVMNTRTSKNRTKDEYWNSYVTNLPFPMATSTNFKVKWAIDSTRDDNERSIGRSSEVITCPVQSQKSTQDIPPWSIELSFWFLEIEEKKKEMEIDLKCRCYKGKRKVLHVLFIEVWQILLRVVQIR